MTLRYPFAEFFLKHPAYKGYSYWYLFHDHTFFFRQRISYSTLNTIIQRINDREKEHLSTRSLDTLLEIIDRGNHQEDASSISSSIRNDSRMQSFDVQKLQLTGDEEQMKQNNSNQFNNVVEQVSLMCKFDTYSDYTCCSKWFLLLRKMHGNLRRLFLMRKISSSQLMIMYNLVSNLLN